MVCRLPDTRRRFAGCRRGSLGRARRRTGTTIFRPQLNFRVFKRAQQGKKLLLGHVIIFRIREKTAAYDVQAECEEPQLNAYLQQS
jgi:hypothetical protein